MKKNLQELADLLNKALTTEYQARVQYLTDLELIRGTDSIPLREKLAELADEEAGHASKLRSLLADYLMVTPVADMAKVTIASNIPAILTTNLKAEHDAIDLYHKAYIKAKECQPDLPYSYEQFEHTIRHIIMDEEEHIIELQQLQK